MLKFLKGGGQSKPSLDIGIANMKSMVGHQKVGCWGAQCRLETAERLATRDVEGIAVGALGEVLYSRSCF